jgi:hypothetical protein
MIETLAQIAGTTGRGKPFVAGLVLWGDGGDDDVVVEVAPVLKRTKGWTRSQVRSYIRMQHQQGWTVSVVHRIEREKPAWFTNRKA